MRFLAVLLCSCALLACGGGGGSAGSIAPPAAPIAEGLWRGTTATGTQVALAILDTGETWGFYTLNDVLVGALHGTSTFSGSTLAGSGTEFNLLARTITPGSFSGNFAAQASMNIIASPFGAFTAIYDTSYDHAASLASLSGTFAGVGVTGTAAPQVTAIGISTSGVISVFGLGCNASGTVKPRASGKNLFDLVITFAGSSCALGNGTVTTGIGYYDLVNRQLLIMTLNASKTDGFIYLGTKL